MSQKEFVSVALDSNILTMKEVGDMMKFYTDITLTSSLPFFQTPRFVSSLYVKGLESSGHQVESRIIPLLLTAFY